MTENWVHSGEASRLLKKSERTLRLHASQGKIKVKKQGKFWLFEVSQFLKNMTPAAPPPLTPSDPTLATANIENTRTLANFPKLEKSYTSKDGSKRKVYKLEDLGVFKDLKWLTEQAMISEKTDHPYSTLLKISLTQVGQGFFEYEYPQKLLKFREARFTLAQLLVECSLSKDPLAEQIQEFARNNIIPGLSGLIRKMGKPKKGHYNERD